MVRAVHGSIVGGGGLRLAAVVVASLRRSLAGNVPVAVMEDGVEDGLESELELELELGMIVGWEELTWPLVDVLVVLKLGILAVESLRVPENVPEDWKQKGKTLRGYEPNFQPYPPAASSFPSSISSPPLPPSLLLSLSHFQFPSLPSLQHYSSRPKQLTRR